MYVIGKADRHQRAHKDFAIVTSSLEALFKDFMSRT